MTEEQTRSVGKVGLFNMWFWDNCLLNSNWDYYLIIKIPIIFICKKIASISHGSHTKLIAERHLSQINVILDNMIQILNI